MITTILLGILFTLIISLAVLVLVYLVAPDEIFAAILAFAIVIVLEILCFFPIAGAIALIMWCFGVSGYFSWKLAIGIYLVVLLIRGLFRSSKK